MTTATKFDAAMFEKLSASDSSVVEIARATIDGVSVHISASWYAPLFSPTIDGWHKMTSAGLFRLYVTDRPFVGGGANRTPCLDEEVDAIECPSVSSVNLKRLVRNYVNKPSHKLVMDRPRTEDGRLALINAALAAA
jgi:hypothetical protein